VQKTHISSFEYLFREQQEALVGEVLAFSSDFPPQSTWEEGYWPVCSLPGYAAAQFCSRVMDFCGFQNFTSLRR
jgi:hypothetical protein